MKSNYTDKIPDLAELKEKLRLEDYKYGQISKYFSVGYWVITPLYLASTVALIIGENKIIDIACSASYLVGFLIMAICMRKYYKTFSHIDYSLPTVIMLQKAARRYSPWQPITLWVLLSFLLVGAGLSLGSANVLRVLISFLGLLSIFLFAGFINWRNRYKPLRDDALKLIKEIES